MKYVFGPVPSRRLGQSLGIDPIPLKTCNWNCVYCQLGRTRPLTNERREYVPCKDILIELEQALRIHHAGEIDWVTFVGSGEPTLHNGIGWLIRQVKLLTELPVAVITNGALLYQPEIREELSAADAVLPSLDAGNPALYRKINRPWPKLTFERLWEGLTRFREVYAGQLWIEVMLIRGLNDTEETLREIAGVLRQIRPSKVQITTPVRPPAEPWVELPTAEGLERATAILGKEACFAAPAAGTFDLAGHDRVTDAVIAILTRHPMSEEDILATLKHWTPGRVQETLHDLLSSGQVQVVERYKRRFWSTAGARFESKNQHSALFDSGKE
jgi:wyosine [tRNA(Phe)-imidazoG37] synthetase (radical SAM superfamily)